jgi:hypothetical protein
MYRLIDHNDQRPATLNLEENCYSLNIMVINVYLYDKMACKNYISGKLQP